MKFNKATIYKVPFDSSYKNVVDYRSFVSTNNIITDIGDADKSEIQRRFFENCPQRVVYNGDSWKSIKTTGRSIKVSVSGSYEDICDYNYIIFYGDEKTLYCFIDSFESNNDSTNSSTSIFCTIDFWNTYYESIINMPKQYHEYAHEQVETYNFNSDDRVPSSFRTFKEYHSLFDDVIIWLKLKLDETGFDIRTWAYNRHYDYMWDAASSGFITGYIPIAFVHNTTEGFVIRPINGYYATDYDISESGELQDYIFSDITQNLSSQYLIDATITFITPSGIFYYDDYIFDQGLFYYFMVDKIYSDNPTASVRRKEIELTKNGEKLYGANVKHNNIFTYGVTAPFIYFSNVSRNIPIFSNTTIEYEYIVNNIPNFTKSIHASNSYRNETNFLKAPYYKVKLKLFNNEFDVTPIPSGSTVPMDSKITFQSWFNPGMKFTSVQHNNHNVVYGVDNTIPFSVNNNSTFVTSTDKYSQYLQTSAMANTIKLVATEIGLLGTAIGATVLGNPLAVIGAGAGMVASASNYIAQGVLAEKLPDQFNIPAFNSLDGFYCSFPVLEYDTLNLSDINVLNDFWTRYGHILMRVHNYGTVRFYYDYMKFRNTTLPNITNPIARRVIEEMFNNGVTIWHCNAVRNNTRDPIGNMYYPSVYDYTKNNPDALGASLV